VRNIKLVAVTVLVLMADAPDVGFSKVAIPATGNDNVPSLAPLIKRVGPSVVSITIRALSNQQDSTFDDSTLRQLLGLPNAPPEMRTFAAGSGVIFDGGRGLIVTNSHVVEHAETISVTLADGREVPGTLQGSDPDTDVAVIRVALPNLAVVSFGDSDQLEVGDYVLAIGNPFGIGQTVTSGIVSGLRRTEMGLERYEDFIQTDASINPGNSGGALVNLRGEVVGINAAMVGTAAGNAGIGFAIPINMVRSIVDQLVKYGSVERGELGFAVSSVRSDLSKKYNLPASQPGAVIARIDPESPAERAGLKVGDLVTSLGSSPVKDAADLRNKLGVMRVGGVADMTVWRDRKSFRAQATLSEPATKVLQGGELTALFEGATFVSGQPRSAEKGVQVSTVRGGSKAWNSGLREGDWITAVNQKRVDDPDRFAEELAKTPERLVLSVTRNDESIVLTIKSNTGRAPEHLP
jgi:Do/DeqQ family serine protease